MWCPVHDEKCWKCSEKCQKKRQEYRRLCHAYNDYWQDRVKYQPMPMTEYAVRYLTRKVAS